MGTHMSNPKAMKQEDREACFSKASDLFAVAR